MKTFWSLLLTSVMIFFLSAWSCNETAYHKANRTAKQVADDLHEFALTVQSQCNPVNGHCTGGLSDDEARGLATWSAHASIANDEFIAQIKSSNSFQGNQSQEILQAFQNLSDAVGNLNSQGILHIKNPKSQQMFNTLYKGIEDGLLILQSVLASQPPPKQSWVEMERMVA